MKVLPDYFAIHKIYDSLFEAAGINETADIDWIMCEVTGKKRSELPFYGRLNSEQWLKVESALKKRLKHIPIGYIFGCSMFYGRPFIVSKDVLIPRLDTETLIEKAIKVIKAKQKHGKSVKVLDIGTGSGAIAITLKKETSAEVTATDISFEALAIAQKNADNLNANIRFAQSDLFENLKGEMFDVIVSNPPYIESDVIKDLQPEVKDYEPVLALDGGKDGLDFYRKIIVSAPQHLNKEGEIIFEIGYNQSNAVGALLQKDFEDIKLIKDYGGNDRVVCAKLKGNLWLKNWRKLRKSLNN